MRNIFWTGVLYLVFTSVALADNSAGMSVDDHGEYPSALLEWESLANKGDPTAQFNLGYRYANGLGVSKNLEMALSWYKKAAMQGDATSAFNMGVIYEMESTVADDNSALRWYNVAAHRCSTKAMVSIGVIYSKGKGVFQNKRKALRWNRRAAEFGDGYAQYKVGLRYWDQEIIPQDLEHAYMWLSLAGQQDEPQGYAIRKLLVKKMTPLQISTSEKLTNDWEPKVCSSD